VRKHHNRFGCETRELRKVDRPAKRPGRVLIVSKKEMFVPYDAGKKWGIVHGVRAEVESRGLCKRTGGKATRDNR